MLETPKVGGEFQIYSDASKLGLGGVLIQNSRVIDCTSRTVSNQELNYSATDLELTAIDYCTTKFRYAIHMGKTVAFTDHKPLTGYVKDIIARKASIQNKIDRISNLNVEIKYIKGKQNVIADLLSRNVANETKMINSINESEVISKEAELNNSETIMKLQQEDDEINDIIHGMNNKKFRIKVINNNYVLFYEDRLVLPSKVITIIIKQIHNKYHCNNEKLKEMMKKKYWFVKFNEKINKFKCDVCELDQKNSCN